MSDAQSPPKRSVKDTFAFEAERLEREARRCRRWWYKYASWIDVFLWRKLKRQFEYHGGTFVVVGAVLVAGMVVVFGIRALLQTNFFLYVGYTIFVAIVLALLALGFWKAPKPTGVAASFLFLAMLIVGALKEHGLFGYVVGATGPVKEYVGFWGTVPYTTALATLAVVAAIPLGIRYRRDNRRVRVRFYQTGQEGSISIKEFDPHTMRQLE